MSNLDDERLVEVTLRIRLMVAEAIKMAADGATPEDIPRIHNPFSQAWEREEHAVAQAELRRIARLLL